LFNDEIPLVSEQLAQQQTDEIVEKPKNETKARAKKKVSQKNERGDFPETVQLTYNIYLTSKSIEETAKKRDLVKSTIESHLMKCVELGMLEVMEFVDNVSIEEIRAMKSSPDDKLSDIKLKLNDKYSYFQIKLALLESKI
jgi:ATP-dependent DNA helicase RecQ